MEKVKVNRELYEAIEYLMERNISFDDFCRTHGNFHTKLSYLNNVSKLKVAEIYLNGYEFGKELYTKENLPINFKIDKLDNKIYYLYKFDEDNFLISHFDYKMDLISSFIDTKTLLKYLNLENGWEIID